MNDVKRTIGVLSTDALRAMGLAAVVGTMEDELGPLQIFDTISSLKRTSELPDVLVIGYPYINIQTVRGIQEEYPQLRLMVLGLEVTSEICYQFAVVLGVRGLLTRGATIGEIKQGILQVCTGDKAWLSGEILQRLVRKSEHYPRLTARECQLVDLTACGYTNRQIGDMLNITEGTVKVYMSHLFQKVGVKNRMELVFVSRQRAA